MRKFLIALIAVVTLGAGTAFAQSGYWAGFSVGYPGAALHFGIEDVTPNLGVRVNAGYNYIGSGFALGLDALYDLDVDTGRDGYRVIAYATHITRPRTRSRRPDGDGGLPGRG